jgi:predicted esterase
MLAPSASSIPRGKNFMLQSISILNLLICTQAALGNKDIPYLQCHGDCDPVVPYKWGQATSTLLKQFLKNTEFKTYGGMMHGSSDEVIFYFEALFSNQIFNIVF